MPLCRGHNWNTCIDLVSRIRGQLSKVKFGNHTPRSDTEGVKIKSTGRYIDQ